MVAGGAAGAVDIGIVTGMMGGGMNGFGMGILATGSLSGGIEGLANGVLNGALAGIYSCGDHMRDVFDFSTMNARSGWEIHSGGGFEYYHFKGHSGIRITLQNDVTRIVDVDLRNELMITIYTRLGRPTQKIFYNTNNYSHWKAAIDFIGK